MMHRVEHVVMIVPVDRDEHEAQDIAQKDGHDRRQRSGLHAMRHLHLENHDRDDDRDDAVGEGLEASLAHASDTTYFRRYRVVDSASVCAEAAGAPSPGMAPRAHRHTSGRRTLPSLLLPETRRSSSLLERVTNCVIRQYLRREHDGR